MQKFEGILLCSDWDGTITDGGFLLRENINAIRYFQREGGKFTFASGRYVDHLKKFEPDIIPNTHIICDGGSRIMSAEGKILYEQFCNEHFEEYSKFLMREDSPYQQMRVSLRGSDPIHFDKKTILTKEAHEILSSPTIYKGIFLTEASEASEIAALKYVASLTFEGYMPMRSFPFSIELIPKTGGKGAAVLWLAKKIGAKLIVTVGDYENDCDMLRVANYGYAVTGGSPLAKAAANRFAASVKSGAIASVIEELDREIT